VDDVIVYRRAADDIFVCVNASNREKDARWFAEQARGFDCTVEDRSDKFGQLAIQGPLAPTVIAAAFPEEAEALAALPPFRHRTIRVGQAAVLVATTGYTGERGFELYIPVDAALQVWDRLWEAGAGAGLLPIGLGARDTLRLEMRYCLYGNDIDETTSPLEAGLGWTVKLEKPAFVGRDALLAQKEGGLTRRLVGFQMVDRGIPRQGYALHAGDESAAAIGRVTSGTQSPTLGEPIGLGYVAEPHHKRGREIQVDVRGTLRRARVVRTPFVER
jgi:aminomethyltransferase